VTDACLAQGGTPQPESIGGGVAIAVVLLPCGAHCGRPLDGGTRRLWLAQLADLYSKIARATDSSAAPAFLTDARTRGGRIECGRLSLYGFFVRVAAIAVAAVAFLLSLSGGAGSSALVSRAAPEKAICPNGSSPSKSVTKIQAIQLDLLRRSSFNQLNGRQVARDLLANRSLWCAALIDRLGSDALIKLRDVDENYWNVDTLYVLSSGANDRLLGRIARHWHADAINWVSGASASRLLGDSRPVRILEVWWD
jgi:hypothetical protein